MSNFDYKKYLVENKLTANSKMLSEAAKKPTIKILKDLYYFDKLGSLGAKDDVDEKYHSGAKLVFKKGKSVADDTTHDDSEYKMITSSKRLEKGVDYEVTTNSKALSLNEEKGAPVSKTKTVNAKLASGADMGTRPASALGMIGTVSLGGQDYEVKAFQGKTGPVYTLIDHESFSENTGMPFWKYFMEKLQDLNGGEEVMFTPTEDVMIQEPTLDPQ